MCRPRAIVRPIVRSAVGSVKKNRHYRDVNSTLRAGFDVEVIEAFQRTCHKLKIGSVREYRRVDHVRHERHHGLWRRSILRAVSRGAMYHQYRCKLNERGEIAEMISSWTRWVIATFGEHLIYPSIAAGGGGERRPGQRW